MSKTNITREELVAALDALFSDEKNGYEFPDDAIVGPFAAKFAALRIKAEKMESELATLRDTVAALENIVRPIAVEDPEPQPEPAPAPEPSPEPKKKKSKK